MTKYGELFDYLEQELGKRDACDNTLRLTKLFAEQHDLSFAALSDVLMDMSGYCDCEVLFNAEFQIPHQDHIGQESFKTPRQVAVELGFFCRPASHEEIVKASQTGLKPPSWIPCAKDDPNAIPDLNRAIKVLHQTRAGSRDKPERSE